MLWFCTMTLITCMLWRVLFRRVHVRGLIRKRNGLLKWDWFIWNEHQLHAYQYHALVNKPLHACWMTTNNQVMHNHSNTNVTDFPQHIMKQVHCHTSPCTTHGLWQMRQKHTVNQCSSNLLTAKIVRNLHALFPCYEQEFEWFWKTALPCLSDLIKNISNIPRKKNKLIR